MAFLNIPSVLPQVNQFQTPNTPNKALQELQTKGAITDATNRSLEGRTAASNASNEFRTGLGLDLNIRSPNFAANLDTRRRSNITNKDSESAVNRGKVGQFARDVAGVSAGDVNAPEAIQMPGIPTATSAATAANIATLKKGRETTTTGPQVGGQPIGIPIVKTKNSESSEAKAKNTPRANEFVTQQFDDAQSARTRADLQRQFPNSVIGIPEFKGGKMVITIDGVQRDIMPTRK